MLHFNFYPSMTKLTTILMILLFWAVPSEAEVEVQYLGNLQAFPVIEHSTTADGIFGNPGQPGGWVTAEEAYGNLGVATTFDPMAGQPLCDAGFTVQALHLVLVKTHSEAETLNTNLAIGDAFLREDYPPDAACFSPTPCPVNSYAYNRYCRGEASIVLEEPGYYEVVFSDDLNDCGCIDTSYTQTITSFLYNLGWEVYFVTDDNSAHCPDHYAHTYFFGECHWQEFDAPGNLLFWAEVSCCDVPVSTECISWDGLKSYYR